MRSDNPDGREQPDLFSEDFDRTPPTSPSSPFLFDTGEDDLGPEEDENIEPSGAGKAFLTMAIVGGLVIVIVGVALWLRTGTEQAAGINTTVAPNVAQKPSLPPPPPSGPPPTFTQTAPVTPSAPAPGPTKTATLSEESPGPEEVLPTEPAKIAEVPPPPRPKPTPAALRSSSKDETGDPRSLVTAGKIAQAARAGQSHLLQAGPGAYTLQVLVACQAETVQRAFRNVKDPDLTLAPVIQSGKQCFRLCWGTYPGLQEAREAAPAAPEYFVKSGKPRPVRIGDL